MLIGKVQGFSPWEQFRGGAFPTNAKRLVYRAAGAKGNIFPFVLISKRLGVERSYCNRVALATLF